MARDKAKDDKHFNCNEKHELLYVSGLYEEGAKVQILLMTFCKEKRIKYSTHQEVYEIIETELGYPVPS